MQCLVVRKRRIFVFQSRVTPKLDMLTGRVRARLRGALILSQSIPIDNQRNNAIFFSINV
jgi:hypothetical protein